MNPVSIHWTCVAEAMEPKICAQVRHEFRNYVDGLLQGSGPLHLAPQGEGHTSIGTRINRVNYFKGAVLEARMTRRALAPSEFLKVRNR